MRWSFLFELQLDWWPTHVSKGEPQVFLTANGSVAIQMEELQGWRNLVQNAIAMAFATIACETLVEKD
jgi:hypothetical protein